MDNEVAQEVAILLSVRWDYQYLLSYGNEQYVGQMVNDVQLTESGLMASMHLVGINPTNQALRGQMNWKDAKDGLGTPALKYIEEMGGLDLQGILGGISR